MKYSNHLRYRFKIFPTSFMLGLLCAHQHQMLTVPPQKIPSILHKAFTLNGTIPTQSWYFNNSYPPSKPLVYLPETINNGIALVKKGSPVGCYGTTDIYLYKAIKTCVETFHGKTVGILGSTKPRYEAVVLAFEGNPVSIDYNKIISQDSRLKTMTTKEWDANPIKFDALISISSFEHDGLGRYGDPINPNGDLEAMAKCKKMLKPGGLLFLAVPIGKDCLVWNAHRIYGKIRCPMLLRGWQTLGFFGASETVEKDFEARHCARIGHCSYQPVFVLQSDNSNKKD